MIGNGTQGGGYGKQGKITSDANHDYSADMPKTADTTAYKHLIVGILMLIGLILIFSAIPTKKRIRVRVEKE